MALAVLLAAASFQIMAMSDTSKLAEAADRESALDRLRVAVTQFTNALEGDVDVGQFRKGYERFNEALKQKEIDTRLTKDACVQTMALDMLNDMKGRLEKGPDALDQKALIEVATAARWLFDNGAVVKDWKKYEEGIEKWSKSLAKKAAEKSVTKK